MSVTSYKQKFIGLLAFASGVYFSEEAKASIFQDHLNPKYKGMMRVQWLKTLGNVMDAARHTGQSRSEAQKAKDNQEKPKNDRKLRVTGTQPRTKEGHIEVVVRRGLNLTTKMSYM